jgi:Cd2+/Zn2+-exporting ATPase
MNQNEFSTYKFIISGTHCIECTQKIETVCKKFYGIKTVLFNFNKSELTISIIKNTTALTEVKKALINLGYKISEVKISNNSKNNFIKIGLIFRKKIHKKLLHKIIKINSYNHNSDNHKLHSHNHSNHNGHSHWKNILVLTTLLLFAFLIEKINNNFGYISFICITLYGLFPTLKKAVTQIKYNYIFSVETLISISSLGAIFIGATKEAATVIILYLIGETLESHTTNRARESVRSLHLLLPDKSTIKKENGKFEIISTKKIKIGDLIDIKPGEKLPVDGIIISGTSYIDESLLTGEAVPIFKKTSDKVNAGSYPVDGNLLVKAISSGQNNTITQLVQLIENAQASKTRIVRNIEAFSRIYTPIILLIAVLTAIIPPIIFSEDFITWIYKGLAVLLIGCPCALVISTPSAISAAITTASKFGIFIKSAASLEAIAQARHIAFDKTGTVTFGKLSIQKIVAYRYDENKILQLAASVENKFTHPIAQSIVTAANIKNISILAVSDAKNRPGIGATANIANNSYLLCSLNYFLELKNDNNFDEIKTLQNEGNKIVIILENKELIGIIILIDKLKPEAFFTIKKLKTLGYNSIILTGDNKSSANILKQELQTEVLAELLPEDKMKYVQNMNIQEPIIMVGDGINDAPALAAAKVGIAMNSGSNVAIDSAEIVIMNNNINAIIDTIIISKKTINNIKQNITIAIGLKIFFLIVTIFANSPLWLAILADTGATLLVTLNALRLLLIKPTSVS